MECMFCGGPLNAKKSRYLYDDDQHMIYVVDVPTQVCDYCEEKSYSPEVSERLYNLCNDLLEKLRPFKVPPKPEGSPYNIQIPAINYSQAS